ncbi:cytochrome P450 [Xylaria venustula]|nr:cytochrome P450 [Xylaria venustula]
MNRHYAYQHTFLDTGACKPFPNQRDLSSCVVLQSFLYTKTPYTMSTQNPTLLAAITGVMIVLLLFSITFAISSFRFSTAHEIGSHTKRPPTVPYVIPFICHGLRLAWDPATLVTKTLAQYGWQTPLMIRAGLLHFTMVASPEHIQAVFKSSKNLSSKPTAIFALQHLLGTPASAIPFYMADDSGMAAVPRKGSQTRPENRIHFYQAHASQKFLSGSHLTSLSERYVLTLRRNLNSLDIHDSWVEYPDLYAFLQDCVFRSSVESLMGPKILEIAPTIVKDFWAFDYNVSSFLRRLPRWLIPNAYKSRDRLLAGIKKWHAYANQHYSCSRIGPDDPDWEPFFGSKLVRARQDYALKMPPMNADARASEDMGSCRSLNANVLPSIFWFILEALKDPILLKQMMSEVAPCLLPTSKEIQITKLGSQPLLQSVYAEVLRLYVAIAMSRTNELDDFEFSGYRIKKNHPIMIFSRPPAMNEEAWATAGRSSAKPLSTFDAERFLVGSYPSRRCQSEDVPQLGSDTSASQRTFSLDGLVGCWIPYGGGQRMCPGGHFAKVEMLTTFALLFSEYDIELGDTDVSQVKPDLRWFPVGALPPTSKVPFRMREKRHD